MPNPHAHYDGPYCSAINRAGAPCRAPAMENGLCRRHGGVSPHSVPRLRRAKRRVLDHDVAFIALDRLIAIATASLDGPSPAEWRALSETLARFDAASQRGQAGIEAMHGALGAMRTLIANGADTTAKALELRKLLTERRAMLVAIGGRQVVSE